MTNFERFLQDNKLKKQDVAEFLGKSASSMTYYCKEGNEPNEAIVEKLAQKWDVSALRSINTKKAIKEDTIQFYINEVALLRQIVENQSAIIARYESLMKVVCKQEK